METIALEIRTDAPANHMIVSGGFAIPRWRYIDSMMIPQHLNLPIGARYSGRLFGKSVAPAAIAAALPEPESECMVCMDAPPDIRMLPCHHAIVCKDCHAKLRDTPDADTCIYCRAPTTGVADANEKYS